MSEKKKELVDAGAKLFQAYQQEQQSTPKKKMPLVPRCASVTKKTPNALPASSSPSSSSPGGKKFPLVPRVASAAHSSPSKSPAPLRFPGLTEEELNEQEGKKKKGAASSSSSAPSTAKKHSLVPRVATLASSPKSPASTDNSKKNDSTNSSGANQINASGALNGSKAKKAPLVPRVARLSSPSTPKTSSSNSSKTPASTDGTAAAARHRRDAPLPRVALLASASPKRVSADSPAAQTPPHSKLSNATPSSSSKKKQGSNSAVFNRLYSTPKSGSSSGRGAGNSTSSTPSSVQSANKKKSSSSSLSSSSSPAVFDRLASRETLAYRKKQEEKEKEKRRLQRLSARKPASAPPTTDAKSKSGKPSIFDKLVDPKLYTSTHRSRFDAETGKGKGIAGRRDEKELPFEESFRPQLQKSPSSAATAATSSSSSSASKAQRKSSSAYEASPIFDRLLDPKLFTGSHKERFDKKTGKGKGIAGRDRPTEFTETMRRDLYLPAEKSEANRRKRAESFEPSAYEAAPIFDRLLDPKLFTGAHKERFDSKTGKGKGLAGRDRPEDFELTMRKEIYHSPKQARRRSRADSAEPSQYKPAPIFDRLLDPKLYTGSHKERFDAETGKGKGLAGRDRPEEFEQSFRRPDQGQPRSRAGTSSSSPTDADAGKSKSSSTSSSAIFDRLSKPETFTGVQKEKFKNASGEEQKEKSEE